MSRSRRSAEVLQVITRRIFRFARSTLSDVTSLFIDGASMRVSKTDLICGLEAPAARNLMRLMRHDYSSAQKVAADFNVDVKQAERLLVAFEQEGYVERKGVDGTGAYPVTSGCVWITTIRGNALAMAGFTKPIPRVKAESLLQAVLERAEAYNADTTRLLSITEIRVFGSYMTPEVEMLGDLDLAVRYAIRDSDTYWEDMQRQAYEESSPSSISAEIMYPLKNMLMNLKQRSRFIKITTENIEQFTSVWKFAYKIEDDQTAIPLTLKHKVQGWN